MAFERFTKDARSIVLAAFNEEARTTGAGIVEAEHLLLALSAHPSLRHLGLDRDQIEQALIQEEERSLASVGITGWDFGQPPPSSPPPRTRLATSAKLALARAVAGAQRRRDRRIGVHHLLLGVVAADHGRVPRALQIADIDVSELRASL